MKNIAYMIFLVFSLAIISCSDDKKEDQAQVVEIELEYSNISLLKDKSTTINILAGNGEYSVKSSNEDVATAEIENNIITITSTTEEDRADAIIIVTDSKYQRASIGVKIAKEFDLVVDKGAINLELGVAGKDESEIHIKEGNLDYQIDLIQSDNFIEVDKNALNTKSKFTIKALAVGQAQVKVTDALGKTSFIDVEVSIPDNVTLSKSSIVFDSFQKTETIKILSGTEKFKAIVDNPMMVQVQVEGDELHITSCINGKTSIVIEDSKGQQSEPIDIEINAVKKAMNLGSSYFCHANFSAITAIDMSIKECKQVTFELTCKMTGYRGLQSFMGLEGNLIIRGKNDDYRDSHPIEIVGLNDQIVLESSSSFNLNEWMNVALVVNCLASNTTDKYKLYINGIEDKLLVKRNDRTHDKVNLVSSNDGNRFEIGRASGQDWRAMRGIVSEARVWTTARSETQIKNNMCTLNEERPQGLLAYWIFSANDDTDFIQDANGGEYTTNLTISAVSGDYSAAKAPKSVFIEDGCPQ